jgi:hypothetical protein
MLAVEIQDPFGKQANDLRIMDFNLEIHDLVGEMWRRWVSTRPGEPAKALAYGTTYPLPVGDTSPGNVG